MIIWVKKTLALLKELFLNYMYLGWLEAFQTVESIK